MILLDDDRAGCADVDAEKRRAEGLVRGRAMRARLRHCLHAEEVDKEAMAVCSFLFRLARNFQMHSTDCIIDTARAPTLNVLASRRNLPN